MAYRAHVQPYRGANEPQSLAPLQYSFQWLRRPLDRNGKDAVRLGSPAPICTGKKTEQGYRYNNKGVSTHKF